MPIDWKMTRPKGRSLKILADPAIATVSVGNGRLIPALIVDTRDRSEIDELVRAHKDLPPGDVVTEWSVPPGNAMRVILSLKFERPMTLEFYLSFDLHEKALLVNQILTSQALYLQPGRPGDTIKNTLDSAPRILMEVPRTGFPRDWDRMFKSAIATCLRKEGMPRRAAKDAAAKFVDEAHGLSDFRMPGQ